MRKLFFFVYAKTKTQISCAVSAQLISAFVFAIRIVQSLYYLNPKFQASGHLLWLYNPVCVGPGRKPRRPVFFVAGAVFYMRLGISLFKGNIVASGSESYLVALCFILWEGACTGSYRTRSYDK